VLRLAGSGVAAGFRQVRHQRIDVVGVCIHVSHACAQCMLTVGEHYSRDAGDIPAAQIVDDCIVTVLWNTTTCVPQPGAHPTR
jgi:hypothetical protein